VTKFFDETSPYFVYDTIASTNQAAEFGAYPDRNIVVFSRQQTAGKGRRGHSWQSLPEMGLYMSAQIQLDAIRVAADQIVFLFGLAAIESLKLMLPHLKAHLKLKWPNDIYMQGRKLAGILAESKMHNGRIRAVICGFGLNLNQNAEDFGPGLNEYAASLWQSDGQQRDPLEFFYAFVKRLDIQMQSLSAKKMSEIINGWLQHGYKPGTPMTITGPDEQTVSGFFDGITANGELRLKTNDTVKTYNSGDLEVVR
jgi:BirA family biotin operon repressor/biotin-[acetyl-CoA-carboxylase] ligase